MCSCVCCHPIQQAFPVQVGGRAAHFIDLQPFRPGGGRLVFLTVAGVAHAQHRPLTRRWLPVQRAGRIHAIRKHLYTLRRNHRLYGRWRCLRGKHVHSHEFLLRQLHRLFVVQRFPEPVLEAVVVVFRRWERQHRNIAI